MHEIPREAPSWGGGTSGGDGGAGGEAEWTTCSSPDGLAVCGGPIEAECPKDDPECGCTLAGYEDPSGKLVGVCLSKLAHTAEYQSLCWECPDGGICIDITPLPESQPDWCVPFNLGVLFAQHGQADRVRYADLGLFTGEPIPAPETCPDLPGVPICGGNCGGCPLDQHCTGRSPLHPYGLCFYTKHDGCRRNPDTGELDLACESGQGCFFFSVQPEAMPLAYRFGRCLPLETCMAAAAHLPGGGECYP